MFRSESESEKPLEGTSRSESPINSPPLSASPGKHSAFLADCSTPLLCTARRTPASSSSGHRLLPCRKKKTRGLDIEEEGKPSTGAKNAQCSPPPDRAPSLRARGKETKPLARRGQVQIALFGWAARSSAHSSGSTLRGGDASPAASPRAERSPCTPGRGASRHPPAPRAPASGARAPPCCSPFLPPPPPPDPSPPGAPRLPSPIPGPPARALKDQPALLAPSCLHATLCAG